MGLLGTFRGVPFVVPGLVGTLRSGTFSSHPAGHPGMSKVVTGLLGTFRTGTFRLGES